MKEKHLSEAKKNSVGTNIKITSKGKIKKHLVSGSNTSTNGSTRTVKSNNIAKDKIKKIKYIIKIVTNNIKQSRISIGSQTQTSVVTNWLTPIKPMYSWLYKKYGFVILRHKLIRVMIEKMLSERCARERGASPTPMIVKC